MPQPNTGVRQGNTCNRRWVRGMAVSSGLRTWFGGVIRDVVNGVVACVEWATSFSVRWHKEATCAHEVQVSARRLRDGCTCCPNPLMYRTCSRRSPALLSDDDCNCNSCTAIRGPRFTMAELRSTREITGGRSCRGHRMASPCLNHRASDTTTSAQLGRAVSIACRPQRARLSSLWIMVAWAYGSMRIYRAYGSTSSLRAVHCKTLT